MSCSLLARVGRWLSGASALAVSDLLGDLHGLLPGRVQVRGVAEVGGLAAGSPPRAHVVGGALGLPHDQPEGASGAVGEPGDPVVHLALVQVVDGDGLGGHSLSLSGNPLSAISKVAGMPSKWQPTY